MVSFLPLIFPYLGPTWWSSFSIFADILGVITIVGNFFLIVTGRVQPVNPRDIAIAVVDEMELRRKYQNLEDVPGSNEVPEEIDYKFTQHRLANASSALRDSGFPENALEFEAVDKLVSNRQITDAIIRTRRAIEILFWSILSRRGESLKRLRVSFRWLVDKLVSHRLLTNQERSVLVEFYYTASKTIHERWTPSDEESTLLISMVAGVVEVVVQRYDQVF